jgi:RNA polymerase sigma-70 factor, ECF subfamily
MRAITSRVIDKPRRVRHFRVRSRLRPAALQPILGFDDVMTVHEAVAVLFRKHGSNLVRTAFINGLPGFVTREADGELQTTALEVDDGMVKAIYVMRNADKLRHLH